MFVIISLEKEMKTKEIELKASRPYIFKKTKLIKHVSYNGSYWLYKKQYFFKFSKHYHNDTGIIVGEILVSRLCKELGVNAVDCAYSLNLHKTYKHRGIISKSFLGAGEKAITLDSIAQKEIMQKYPKELLLQMKIIFSHICPITNVFGYKDLHLMAKNIRLKYENNSKLLLYPEKKFIEKNLKIISDIEKETKTEENLTVDECLRRINVFAKEQGCEVVGNPKLELQKMAIIDAITKQADRHAGNISIIFDEKRKTAKLAPMYDNGMCECYSCDVSMLRYPLQSNCYIKLNESDYKEMQNKQTEISKFYERVKDFYHNKIDACFEQLQEEFSVMNKFLERHETLKENEFVEKRELQKSYWIDAKTNYKNGLQYLQNGINKSNKNEQNIQKI